ncbi:Uncharacterised protein [Nocardia africana]|uniref:Uncharacterized protein n=1 Tax=Nocardia africana TaxID=134964 RepID=A0A378WII4_9NOCA|nr:Uncharacterised protein [Nocardia africana]
MPGVPGLAVQVTEVNWFLSFFSVFAVQPGTGSVRAADSCGSATVSLVVEAVADSVGTRKVMTA